MPQNTNLNVSPYFDDFNENKNYHKVLFKPGFPVQARELTTLQSILQNQVEKFGRHFFKEGSMVIPGGTFYDPNYFAVKIDPNFLNIPVNSYTKFLVDNNIKIQGETSGVEATVVNRLTAPESIDGFDTLYLKYSKSGSDGTTRTFQDGENLITLSGIAFENTSIAANSQFARCIVANSTSTGSSFSINEGVYFVRGFFVKTIASTVILDQYSNSPSYRVGFLIKEEKTSASSTNSDLYDNALGFSNEAAPGADRLKISVSLHKKSLTDINDKDFVELMRVVNGSVKEMVTATEYNIFAKELARRTYDESGDYYVKPFSIDVKESLNDRIGNRGIYFDTQQTQNGNTPSDDIISLQVSSGKAYVRGYEIDKVGSTSIDVLKPRTTKLEENISIPIRIGKSMNITNVLGSPAIGFNASSLKLLNRRLLDTRQRDTGAAVIGDVRPYDFMQRTSAGIAVTTFDLRFYDMQLYTVLTVANTITTGVDSHVKGKFSGAVGYVVTAVSGTSITLRDVIGEFQINEPLIVNGLEIGNNITTIVDNSFEDIKAVHSTAGVSAGTTSFSADLVLDRDKEIFRAGEEISIVSGLLKNPSVKDYRSLVKENDIIGFAGNVNRTDITFNRVSSIGVGGTNFQMEAVATVPGVCDGVIGNITPNHVTVKIPTLTVSDDPGFRVKLADDFVSSMNVLDSSYIVRKQITNGSFTNFQAVFNITDLTDLNTDDLFFEPFTQTNYALEVDAGTGDAFMQKLDSPMVNVSTNLKTVTISGLSKETGDATLTATIRRSSLSSKEKSIVRCSDLVITKSESTGSGIGTTSLNDGLTYSQYYGTRVQDEEISLNVPEVSRVLAIFESNDTNNPDLPTLIATDATATFTGNVTVGEQFIGGTSGAVARVVSVVSGTSISFVYENQNTFEVGENISLKTSGIFASLTSVLPGDRNLLNNYTLDDGQRLEFADFSRIVRKSDAEKPTRKLRIIFDYLLNNETAGTIETVNSYNTLSYSKDIPLVFDRFASDFIDFRPRVTPFTANNKSPFSFGSRSFSSTQSEVVASNETLVVDYSYYQGRVDRLYLTKDGFFTVKEGTPSRLPKLPLPNEEAFEVASISYPPYVRNANQEVTVKTVRHKRYTMKDIGSLEHRIKNLENYTTLSLLETDTKNLSIKDPNTGLDKFKSGFFVDNFTDHTIHNLKGESKFDIDLVRGECRPRSTERNVPLIHETVSTLGNPVNTDYRWSEDFVDGNITRNGPALILNHTDVEFLTQPFATRTENLNPFHIALFAGTIQLNPESDFWVEEVPLGAPAVFNIDTAYNALAELLDVEDRENGGMASSFWNSHEITWNGRDSATFLGEEITDVEVLSSSTEQIHQAAGHGTEVLEVTNQTIQNTITQTFSESGIEREFGLQLTPNDQVIDLGNKVLGIDILYNVRSRNVEVVGKRLKPNTRYYVFMENVDMTAYAVPKLLPVVMTRGSFSTGDLMYSVENPPGTAGRPSIHFRLTSSNHKIGPFNAPTETYTTNPYDSSSLPDTYSSTSTILNIDTGGLAFFTEPDHIGYVNKGMNLVNANGDAEATVSDLSLVSDEKGDLIFSLHIPDPTVESSPLFTTGNNTIRITTSPTNASILDPGESSAETEYLATGYQTNTQEQTLNIRTPQIETLQIGSDQPVTRIFTEDVVQDPVNVQTSERIDYYDPLAQSFLVERDQYQDGVFITGGELFFKTKDNEVPVTVQLRTMRDGSPTTTILPFGEVQIDPAQVNASDDPTVATNFRFNTPVYLQSGYEYALVLVAPTEKYLTYITRMGEEDLILQSVSNRQPYLGSLFKSQNSSTWTPSQLEDLKFKLNKAQFVTNTPSSVLLRNSELQLQRIRKTNPVTAFSKRLTIGIGETTISFTSGAEVTQGTNTGRVFSSGGKITSGTSKIEVAANTGIGLTPTSGSFTYSGIGFTTLTGSGSGAVAAVTVNGGAVTSGNVNITNGGTGYQVGDLLLMNSVGFNGSGVRAVVKNITNTNQLIIDEVEDTFVDSQPITYIETNGVNFVINAADVTGISSDPIRDGYTLKFDHRNHGMHSNTNRVRVSNFHPDVKPTLITSSIDDDSTTIDLTSDTDFTTFEGTAVGAGHTGYLLIDREIIAYNAIANNQITISTRSVDSSFKSNHSSSSLAHKYEFNGLSLRKINTDHNIDSREKTFDSYHLKIATDGKTFQKTKTGGGSVLHVSQNVPFEIIDPRITSITPTGTNITGRIKTTSGTSLSGNEASFVDKGYEPVALNQLNYLDSPRIIASEINEFDLLGNEKSFGLELTLSTTKEDVSPVVDLDTLNVVGISNLVDDKVSNFETDNRPKISGFDPNTAIYETRKINLEFVSNSIFVQFDGHREPEGEFRVFYKLFRGDGDDMNQNYIPFNGNGLPDKTVNPNAIRNAFSEYKFTVENTAQFTGFMIKVVMTSTSQAKPPRLKNFRAIALRSFQIDD
jgi:hypothetical protein